MTLPVSDPSFWKDRIEMAKKNGRDHYAVYLSHDKDWKYIADMHKIILERECKDLNVLDAGCAYGRAAEWFPPDLYTGVDISPDLIKLAQQKYPDHRFSVADIRHLPFPTRSFDVAFAISIKQMIEGNLGVEIWEEMENELRRVAKKLVLLEYTEPNKYQVIINKRH